MNKTIGAIVLLVVLIGILYAVSLLDSSTSEEIIVDEGVENIKDINIDNLESMQRVNIKTNKGDIAVDLLVEEMPITTGNFLSLAREGFYNGIKFHRVIPDFMVQVGDPLTKDDEKMAQWGSGGPGYTIKDEFVEGFSNVRGTLSMANTGLPNSGGSQFFINVVDNTGLDYDKEPSASKHPVFGLVVNGMDVVDEIVSVPTEGQGRPIEPIVIESIEIIE